LLVFLDGGGLGGAAVGLMGLDVAIEAGRLCRMEPIMFNSGFSYFLMSSLLETLGTIASEIGALSLRSLPLLLNLPGLQIDFDLAFSGDN